MIKLMYIVQKKLLAALLLMPVMVFCSGYIDQSSNDFLQPSNGQTQGAVEKITIYSQEHADSDVKIARKGILVRFKDAKATILLAHGYMCNKFDVGFLRNLFPYGQYNFLSFDFRAHGEDVQGQSCTLGHEEALDVIAAAQFLKNHPDLKDKPLFAYAFSMGAVATIEAQSRDDSLFDALILDCPFDSSENVIKRGLDKVKLSVLGYDFDMPGKSILQKYAFHPYVQSFIKVLLKAVAKMDPRNIETNIAPVHPALSIAKVTIPCFFIHCKQDEKVPVSAVKEVYEGAAGPKMLWLTNGRSHYDSFFYNPEKYVQQVRLFFDQVMAGQWKDVKKQKIMEDGNQMLAGLK